MRRLKVLFVCQQCNPELVSVPLISWKLFEALSVFADVTLVTHERHAPGFAGKTLPGKVDFIEPGQVYNKWYQLVQNWFNRAENNWALVNALSFPMYASFNKQVYKRYAQAVRDGEYDIVHAFTPVNPRYPVKLVQACTETPFVLGPVNGGLDFPPAFQLDRSDESSWIFRLRDLVRYVPGYLNTYRSADLVLMGSSATQEKLEESLQLRKEQTLFFPENGIPNSFFHAPQTRAPGPLRLLFVGRLVPSKGCQYVIEALGRLSPEQRTRLHLDIVGYGALENELKSRVTELGLDPHISFHGRVSHEETISFYQQADLFCFPSVREFGGGVVLEAMASGCPCIVVDYGGPADLVSTDCGILLKPDGPNSVIQELAQLLPKLATKHSQLEAMGKAAFRRAQEHAWTCKGKQLIQVYQELLAQKRTRVPQLR